MRTRRPLAFAAVAAALAPAALAPAALAQDGDAARGQKIAEQHCSRCHVIGDFNKFGGIGSTPSFNAIKYIDDWRLRFQTFYARNPHPSVVRIEGIPPPTDLPPNAEPVFLKLDDVDDIVAFADTLEKR